jgi:hypothetical protein
VSNPNPSPSKRNKKQSKHKREYMQKVTQNAKRIKYTEYKENSISTTNAPHRLRLSPSKRGDEVFLPSKC